MKRIVLLFLLFFLFAELSIAQKTVVLIDQHGNPVNSSWVTMITAIDSVFLKVQTDRFVLPVDLTQTAPVTLKINGPMMQPYFNQYLPVQLWSLDTIRVYLGCCSMSTPIFFVTHTASIDLPDWGPHEWFGEYLSSLDLSASCFELVVFNTHSLSADQRRRYALFRKAFCTHFAIPEESVRLVFSEKPYTCTRHDFFRCGTVVTPDFVASQHTDFMRKKAETYLLGSQLMITERVYR